MMRENDEVLKMMRTICNKIIDLHDCYQEQEDCVRTFELDDIAYLARIVLASVLNEG